MSSDEPNPNDAEGEASDAVVIEPVEQSRPQPPPNTPHPGAPHPGGEPHSGHPARAGARPPHAGSPPPHGHRPPSYPRPRPAPVELEAVAAQTRPHPLRFGIKAMFGVTLLCAVQFALISYVGTLLGIVLGAAACLVVIAGLVVAAMVYRPEGESRALDYMDQLAIRLTLAVVILLLGFIVAGGGTLAWTEIIKLRRDSVLQNELGFTAERDRLLDANLDFKEVLVVKSVAPGRPFDQAGIRKDDAILLDDEETDLYAVLDSNRGSQVTLNVASGNSTSSKSLGRVRAVAVSVPGPPKQR